MIFNKCENNKKNKMLDSKIFIKRYIYIYLKQEDKK